MNVCNEFNSASILVCLHLFVSILFPADSESDQTVVGFLVDFYVQVDGVQFSQTLQRIVPVRQGWQARAPDNQ